MAAEEEKNMDFYSVLGLKKECSDTELRTAYKKLALKWHPDRCASSRDSKYMEEAKKKFQAIQEAYSVLSNANKRFMYDIGVYENDDDEIDEMGDFLGEMAELMTQTKPNICMGMCPTPAGEMAELMTQTKPNENAAETFQDLQMLFNEMFQNDMQSFSYNVQNSSSNSNINQATSCSSSFNSNSNNKRNCADMNSGQRKVSFSPEFHVQNFCLGAEGGLEDSVSRGRGGSWKRRNGRKQKVSSQHAASTTHDSKISV